MAKGKSIKLFLVDGSPQGIITAGIGQWTGQAVVVPRAKMDVFGSRREAGRPGVYVLVGPDPEHEERERIYVGEGEVVLTRLKDHLGKKEFWTRACVFTASDEGLTKSHIQYLESRLVQIGKDSGRAILDNVQGPNPPALPEADVSDMEQFLEHIQVLLPVLGIDSMRPGVKLLAESEDAPTFSYTVKGATARAREVEGEFVVLAGSTTSAKPAKSWDTYQTLHSQLKKEGVLVEDPNNADLMVFKRDVSFSSPSAAGAIVSASNVSGRAVWKVEGANQTYGDWQDEKLQNAASLQSP